MKNKKQLIRGIIFLIVGIILLIVVITLETKREYDVTNNITYLASNNNTKEKDILNVFKNKETSVIFFTDSKDVIVKDIFDNITFNYINIKVYYFNLESHERILELDDKNNVVLVKESTNFYNELLKYLGAFSEVYSLKTKQGGYINTGFKKIITPYAVFVKDGNIIYSHYIAEDFFDNYSKKDLKKIYKTGFELLK